MRGQSSLALDGALRKRGSLLRPKASKCGSKARRREIQFDEMPEREAALTERRLKRALDEVEAKISELYNEKWALQRQIAKVRAERDALSGGRREDNAGMVDRRILETLLDAPGPMSTRLLLSDSRAASFELSEAKFRLRLQGLKQRGHIETAGHRGGWRLTTPYKNRPEATQAAESSTG